MPALLKACENLHPGPKVPESKDLASLAVAVCWAVSLLIQMTFVPGLMVILAGLKLKYDLAMCSLATEGFVVSLLVGFSRRERSSAGLAAGWYWGP